MTNTHAPDPAASASDAAEAAAPFGPILDVESVTGLEGVKQLFHGETFTVLTGTAARVLAEEAGAQVPHPLAPRWLGRTERAWVIERALGAPGVPLEALTAAYGGRTERIEKTLAELLAQPEVNASKALLRAGASRSRIDRALGRVISIELEVGPTLGGASTSWLRTRASAPDRAMSLVMRRAEAEGWPVIDLAAAEVRGEADLSSFFLAWGARASNGGRAEREARARAYDVAVLKVALRELVLGGNEEAAALALARFDGLEGRAPDRVRLSIEAPVWLDRTRYHPLGEDVSASHARFVMRALDGITLGGSTVHVTTEPAIHPGRAARPFEGSRERMERIFGHPEARFDDEGLFSATPVTLARELAFGLSGVVIDGTCGLGCLAMAAAERPEVTKVIAIDRDPARLELARHNARLRRLLGRIEFIEGDIQKLLPELSGSALILDPPWGGRDYERGRVSLGDLPLDVRPLIAAFRGAVRLKLPRGVFDLPAGFTPRAAIDERGVVKYLLATRP